jgi:hypothetical protein
MLMLRPMGSAMAAGSGAVVEAMKVDTALLTLLAAAPT